MSVEGRTKLGKRYIIKVLYVLKLTAVYLLIPIYDQAEKKKLSLKVDIFDICNFFF